MYISHTRQYGPAQNALCQRSGTFKGHFRESVRGLLIRCWRWSLARGRLALLSDETVAGSSPRSRRTRRSLSGNAVVQSVQVVTRQQDGKRACPGCWRYASLTLSAGECKVSGGNSKVNRMKYTASASCLCWHTTTTPIFHLVYQHQHALSPLRLRPCCKADTRLVML